MKKITPLKLRSTYYYSMTLSKTQKGYPAARSITRIHTDSCMEKDFWSLQWGRPCFLRRGCAYSFRPSPATSSLGDGGLQLPVLPSCGGPMKWVVGLRICSVELGESGTVIFCDLSVWVLLFLFPWFYRSFSWSWFGIKDDKRCRNLST